MRAEIGQRPTAESLVPAPVSELVHIFVAVFRERARGHLVFLGPAEVFLDRAIPLPLRCRQAAAKLRLMQQTVQREKIARVAAPLMTDLQQFSGCAHGLHHRARPLDRVAHHFLAVHMQAGLQAGIRHGRVTEIRRSDHDRLQVLFLGQQVLIVLVGADFIAELLQVARALVAVVIPDIADRHKPDALNIQKGFEQNLAFLAITDEGNVEGIQRRLAGIAAFVRRNQTCIRSTRGRRQRLRSRR